MPLGAPLSRARSPLGPGLVPASKAGQAPHTVWARRSPPGLAGAHLSTHSLTTGWALGTPLVPHDSFSLPELLLPSPGKGV